MKAGEKLVLAYVYNQAALNGPAFNLRLETLSNSLGISPSSAWRHLKSLKEKGFITAASTGRSVKLTIQNSQFDTSECLNWQGRSVKMTTPPNKKKYLKKYLKTEPQKKPSYDSDAFRQKAQGQIIYERRNTHEEEG